MRFKYPDELKDFILSRIPVSKKDFPLLVNEINKKFDIGMTPRKLTDYCSHRKICLGTYSKRKYVVGDEFLRNGLVYVMTESGKSRNKAALIWESHNRPLADDEVVTFLDQDRRNFDIENLVVLTKKESGYLGRRKLLTTDPEQTMLNIIHYRTLSVLRERARKLGMLNSRGLFKFKVSESQEKYAAANPEKRRESSRKYLQKMRDENPEKYREWIKKCNSYRKQK